MIMHDEFEKKCDALTKSKSESAAMELADLRVDYWRGMLEASRGDMKYEKICEEELERALWRRADLRDWDYAHAS